MPTSGPKSDARARALLQNVPRGARRRLGRTRLALRAGTGVTPGASSYCRQLLRQSLRRWRLRLA